MRIALGIIGLALGLIIVLQSCAVGTLGSLAEDQSGAQSGQVGMFVGLLFFLGGAFGFGLPLIAAVIFGLAAILGFANATVFPDMRIWAIIALALTAMALFAWRLAKRTAKTS